MGFQTTRRRIVGLIALALATTTAQAGPLPGDAQVTAKGLAIVGRQKGGLDGASARHAHAQGAGRAAAG